MTCRENAMTSGVLCGFLPRPLGTGLHSYHKALG